ncbi:MAG TPA: hypothetical protein VM802_07010 [Chitinophaga sp.]|uniref:hypothetical protein n=1 Tax=Chitinophaga sp. TaxID=1869181 RepID=UPI002CD77D69|nr:hypothetical protein [Chitinophaga sp.]HVI44599.1 hypothetical protein [Chitinophaga sp.]
MIRGQGLTISGQDRTESLETWKQAPYQLLGLSIPLLKGDLLKIAGCRQSWTLQAAKCRAAIVPPVSARSIGGVSCCPYSITFFPPICDMAFVFIKDSLSSICPSQ